MTDELRLSPSKLDMLSKCGIQYEYRYVKGLKIPPSVGMLEGRAIDKAASSILRHKLTEGSLPTDEAVADHAGQEMRTEGNDAGEGLIPAAEALRGGKGRLGYAVDRAIRMARKYRTADRPERHLGRRGGRRGQRPEDEGQAGADEGRPREPAAHRLRRGEVRHRRDPGAEGPATRSGRPAEALRGHGPRRRSGRGAVSAARIRSDAGADAGVPPPGGSRGEGHPGRSVPAGEAGGLVVQREVLRVFEPVQLLSPSGQRDRGGKRRGHRRREDG